MPFSHRWRDSYKKCCWNLEKWKRIVVKVTYLVKTQEADTKIFPDKEFHLIVWTLDIIYGIPIHTMRWNSLSGNIFVSAFCVFTKYVTFTIKFFVKSQVHENRNAKSDRISSNCSLLTWTTYLLPTSYRLPSQTYLRSSLSSWTTGGHKKPVFVKFPIM